MLNLHQWCGLKLKEIGRNILQMPFALQKFTMIKLILQAHQKARANL